MGNFIFNISLAIVMAICIIINIILGSWFALVICTIAFIMDTISAFISFRKWKNSKKIKEIIK